MAASNTLRMFQSPFLTAQEPNISDKGNLPKQELSNEDTHNNYLHEDKTPGDFPGNRARALLLLPDYKSSIPSSSRVIASYGSNSFVEYSRLFKSQEASLVYETKKVPDIFYYCTTSDTQYDCTHHQVCGVNIGAIPEDHHSSLPIQLSNILVTGILLALPKEIEKKRNNSN